MNQLSIFDVMDRQVTTFFNSIHLSGPDLAKAKEQTGLQDQRVLEIFRFHVKMTPVEAWEAYCSTFPECPLTSIRRSITVLTGLGRLQKTAEMKQGKYGKRNFIWEINKTNGLK